MKNHSLKITILVFIFLSGPFQKLTSQTNTSPILRLEMNSHNFNDETVFYFQQGGTVAFQPAFDAYKLVFGNLPYIGSLSDSILTSISGLPELTVNTSVPVKVITPTSAIYTFSTLLENFPNDVCVTLFDAFTGISTNILTTNYACMLYDTTTVARFVINFYTTSSAGITSLNQPICSTPNGGIISAKGSGNGPWNYEWKKGDSIIKTCLNKNTSDSLQNLVGGNYSLKINSLIGCDHFTKTFTIDSIIVPTAAFEFGSLSNSESVTFTNTSTDSQFNAWDFGDNSGTWYIPSPTYKYITPGSYSVTLTCESKTHCKSQVQKTIHIASEITNVAKNNLNEGMRLANSSQGNYKLAFSFDKALDLQISLQDLNGTVLEKNYLVQITTAVYPITLESMASGMYLLKVLSNHTTERTFKLIK